MTTDLAPRVERSTSSPAPRAARRRPSPVWRLLFTVWLVYAAHATTNVVRETYLAISAGSELSLRVDRYVGLHPDLFEIPGRGAYINNNPGASLLGAIPYGVLVHPAISLATRLRPEIAAPKPPATYDDPRPNRTLFMNEARARGLDIVLGLAAIGIQVTLMAPLGALATLLMFVFLRGRLGNERQALWLSLLFAFATPQFFRAAFLNQNAILAHLVLASYVLMVGITPRPASSPPSRGALFGIGLLLGYGLVCDYSAASFLVVFGLWILHDAWRRGGWRSVTRDASLFVAGGLGPMVLLLGYQWAAFGHPLWPAQRYMPPTPYSVKGWLGFTLPTRELLVGNLVDLRYGLFTFSPLLLVALAAPFMKRRHGGPTARELTWIVASFVALYLFSSANQYANLQFNTGVRYMVPAAPLLFIAAVPVLLAAPRVRWLFIVPSLVISLAVSMTREDVPTALSMVAREGPMLPVTIVLEKMSSGYPGLAPGTWLPPVIYLGIAGGLWLVWRGYRSGPSTLDGPPAQNTV